VLKQSVLIVDDEPMTRDLLRLMLERAGFDISEAEDGIDALEKIRDSAPDAVILDVMMPHMDGITVCEILRREEATVNLPVVMLSARTHMDAVAKGLLAGATRYLSKPVSRQDLIQNLREVIAGIPSPETQMLREQLIRSQD